MGLIKGDTRSVDNGSYDHGPHKAFQDLSGASGEGPATSPA